jgi:hypothetical protein
LRGENHKRQTFKGSGRRGVPLGCHEHQPSVAPLFACLSVLGGMGRLSPVILRDMTDADLDVLFDIQNDDIARQMAAFTTPDSGERDSYVAKWHKILANDEITKKVILVDDETRAACGAT